MEEQLKHNRTARRRVVAVLAIIAVAAPAVGVLPSAADHGGPHLEPLARGSFSDDVAASIRAKLDGRRTHVRNVSDASDVVVLRITIDDGARAGWHGHTGPGILVNTGPGTFTSVISDDCVPREYGPGEALVDPGQGTLHAGWNASGETVVLYAIFLGIADGPVFPADPPDDCDPFP
jgi:hypothetical protein